MEIICLVLAVSSVFFKNAETTTITRTNYTIPLQIADKCTDTKVGNETFVTYYDTYLLQCLPCVQNRTYQTRSPDGNDSFYTVNCLKHVVFMDKRLITKVIIITARYFGE